MNYDSLKTAVRARIHAAGGLRRLSRQTKVSPSYLCRISKGERVVPSDDILAKLGLEKVIRYRDTP